MLRAIICTILFFFGLLLASGLYSQVTDSNAVNKGNEGCGFISPYQIVIDDLLKYELPEEVFFPENYVDFNLSWGYSVINPLSKTAILQIEIETSKIENHQTPLNVCVVVDRSASMSEHRRMENVKIALKEFFRLLRPNDYASIVVYDDYATLILPAQRMYGNQYQNIANLIDGIDVKGSTNMVSGMLLGYKEVLKNYNPEYANRVILLTDGIANLGVTDPDQIAEHSRSYNRKGIEISTIGVGADINFNLLNKIAHEGRGLSHFIGDCDSVRNDAIKVFKDELNNMLSFIRDPVIEISFPKNIDVEPMTDFITQQKRRTISIPFKNFYPRASQVCLIQFSAMNRKLPAKNDINVKFSYFDVLSQKTVSKAKKVTLLFSNKPNSAVNMLENNKVRNNYYIALMASMLKKSAKEYESKYYNVAYQTIAKCLEEVESKFDFTNVSNNQYAVYQLLLRQKEMIRKVLK